MATEHEDKTTETEDQRPNSVVRHTYKARYAEKPARGLSKKAGKRTCGDWLAVQIGQLCLTESDQLDVAKFDALLDANGIERHHKWNRTTKGWQGRLRMSGRMVLARVVAEANGELVVPGEANRQAPRAWVAKHE